MSKVPDSDSSKVSSENDLFYFESDHLALRGNKDYSELLKTLFILNAQRQRAIKDFEKIAQIKNEALNNPEETLKKISSNSFHIPPMISVAEIPVINWNSYETKIPDEELKAIHCDNPVKEEVLKKNDKTHKQPWTPEEQKRLEELLVVYPPEAVELRRIKKIAAALGNRTVKQVASRLQKYYIKLCRAGMRVPGPLPKAAASYKKQNKNMPQLWKPSTFFPEYDISVVMNESENAPGPSNTSIPSSTNSSHNYLMPGNYLDEKEELKTEKSESELKLDLLKRIKLEKVKESKNMGQPFQHVTFRCDYCNEEPILGTRWHCTTCTQESIDFCTDCLVSQLYSDNYHPLVHKFVTFPDADVSNDVSSDSESEPLNNELSESSDESDCDESSQSSTKQEARRSETAVRKMKGKKSSKTVASYDTKVGQMVSFGGSPKQPSGLNGQNVDPSDFMSTEDVSYQYLHSNLLLN